MKVALILITARIMPSTLPNRNSKSDINGGTLSMEKNWLYYFCYLRLTELGYAKGQIPATDQVVDLSCISFNL